MRAVKMPARSRRFVEKGADRLRAGQFAEAVEFFDWARMLDPRDPQTRLNLGLALQRAGRHTEALQHFTDLQKERPDFYGTVPACDGVIAGSRQTGRCTGVPQTKPADARRKRHGRSMVYGQALAGARQAAASRTGFRRRAYSMHRVGRRLGFSAASHVTGRARSKAQGRNAAGPSCCPRTRRRERRLRALMRAGAS